MAFYEAVFIARQELSAGQVEALASNITEIITQRKGEVTKTEFCGIRTLAYTIKKNRKGHYVLFNLDAPAPAILEMERQLRLNEDILRYLTLRIEKLDQNPSSLMVSKQNRERRFESYEEEKYGSKNSEKTETDAEGDKE